MAKESVIWSTRYGFGTSDLLMSCGFFLWSRKGVMKGIGQSENLSKLNILIEIVA